MLRFLSVLVVSVSTAAHAAPQGLSESYWRQIESLSGVDVKNDGGDIVQAYIFFDPNCPVCAQLWRRLYAEQSGYRKVATRWIPVAYLKPSSSRRAAHLLSTQSAQALRSNFEKFDFNKQEGGVVEADVSIKLAAEITAAQRLWDRLGGATPLIVYKTKDGATFSQMGLVQEEPFLAMVQSFRSARLAAYK